MKMKQTNKYRKPKLRVVNMVEENMLLEASSITHRSNVRVSSWTSTGPEAISFE